MKLPYTFAYVFETEPTKFAKEWKKSAGKPYVIIDIWSIKEIQNDVVIALHP